MAAIKDSFPCRDILEAENTEMFQDENTSKDTNDVSIAENISRVRLTIEEIIATDNEVSRQSYLSPIQSPMEAVGSCDVDKDNDDSSSVSSAFDSDMVSICTSTSNLSKLSGASMSTLKSIMNDPFYGIDDEDFSNLDRFGFLTIGSKSLSTGSISRESEYMERERLKIQKDKEREASRALKWVDMLKYLEKDECVNNWPVVHRKFNSRLIKGIPDCLRTRVWGRILKTKGLYNSTMTLETPEFSSLYLKVSGFERQIDLDIERTLRDHVLFKIRYSQSQISLFKILVAYSNLDPEVGYCQGMSTIAAFLLLYFDETSAYEAFASILRRDDLRLMYKTGFPLLFEYFWIQERLMKKFLPDLWVHLEKHSIATSIYATKWYLTLFLSFPTKLAARIWDLFLYYGVDILPLTAVALLKLNEKAICEMGFEGTMQFLGRMADAPNCMNPDRLIRMIGQLGDKYFGTNEFDKKHSRGFFKYRKEYTKAHPPTS